MADAVATDCGLSSDPSTSEGPLRSSALENPGMNRSGIPSLMDLSQVANIILGPHHEQNPYSRRQSGSSQHDCPFPTEKNFLQKPMSPTLPRKRKDGCPVTHHNHPYLEKNIRKTYESLKVVLDREREKENSNITKVVLSYVSPPRRVKNETSIPMIDPSRPRTVTNGQRRHAEDAEKRIFMRMQTGEVPPLNDLSSMVAEEHALDVLLSFITAFPFPRQLHDASHELFGALKLVCRRGIDFCRTNRRLHTLIELRLHDLCRLVEMLPLESLQVKLIPYAQRLVAKPFNCFPRSTRLELHMLRSIVARNNWDYGIIEDEIFALATGLPLPSNEFNNLLCLQTGPFDGREIALPLYLDLNMLTAASGAGLPRRNFTLPSSYLDNVVMPRIEGPSDMPREVSRCLRFEQRDWHVMAPHSQLAELEFFLRILHCYDLPLPYSRVEPEYHRHCGNLAFDAQSWQMGGCELVQWVRRCPPLHDSLRMYMPMDTKFIAVGVMPLHLLPGVMQAALLQFTNMCIMQHLMPHHTSFEFVHKYIRCVFESRTLRRLKPHMDTLMLNKQRTIATPVQTDLDIIPKGAVNDAQTLLDSVVCASRPPMDPRKPLVILPSITGCKAHNGRMRRQPPIGTKPGIRVHKKEKSYGKGEEEPEPMSRWPSLHMELPPRSHTPLMELKWKEWGEEENGDMAVSHWTTDDDKEAIKLFMFDF